MQPRIFISYARSDGIEASRQVRACLVANGLAVWQDLTSLEGGRDWWTQIENALRSPELDHLVLIISPNALRSAVIKRELRLARSLGKQVTAIRSGPELDYADVPRWLGHVADLTIPEQMVRFLRTLEGPSHQTRAPLMVPDIPDDFVVRAVESEKLKRLILDDRGDAKPANICLRAPSGFGKSTLAIGLANDESIKDAYYDGVLWIELGPQHEEMRIVAKIQDLLVVLNGEAPALHSVDAAASKLADAIGDRRLLIVIDDVWSERALEPFLVRAPNCTRVVTSQTHLAPSKRLEDHLIGQMNIDEGLALLQGSLSGSPSKRFNETASKVLVRIGYWPQLIKLVGGFIRSRVVDAHQTPENAIADAMSRLDSRGLTAFDSSRQQGYADRHMAVGAVINLTMNLLTDQEQARLRALVVFVPGTLVPIDLASKFWGATQALDQIASEDFLLRLQSLSLLSDLDFGLRHFRMGDLVREFILDQIRPDDLLNLHMTFCRTVIAPNMYPDLHDQSSQYIFRFSLWSLDKAGDSVSIQERLTNPRWMEEKVLRLGVTELISDYSQYAKPGLCQEILTVLRIAQAAISERPFQLIPQLIGRIPPDEDPEKTLFLAQCFESVPPLELCPVYPTLTGYGPETRRFGGQRSAVAQFRKITPDLMVWGDESGVITFWSIGDSADIIQFTPKEDSISDIQISTGGKLAIAYSDGEVLLFDYSIGLVTGRWQAHDKGIYQILWSGETRLWTAGHDTFLGEDGKLRCWNTSSFDLFREVNVAGSAICRLDEAHILVGTRSGETRNVIVDELSGRLINVFGPQYGTVIDIALLSESTFVTGSDDGQIRFWDVNESQPVREVRVTGGEVHRMKVLSPEQIVISTTEGEILLMSASDSAVEMRFQPGDSVLSAFSDVFDGEFLCGSGFSGETMVRGYSLDRLMDLVEKEQVDQEIAAMRFEKILEPEPSGNWAWETACNFHTDDVVSVAWLTNELVVSAAMDRTLKIWNAYTFEEVALFRGDLAFFDLKLDVELGQIFARDRDNRYHVFEYVRGREAVEKAAKRWN